MYGPVRTVLWADGANRSSDPISIKQIVPTLADRGVYIASESSFYRVLREANQMNHRGKSKSPRTVTKPQAYTANGANQIWSWDITYLASTIKGMFYYVTKQK